MAGPSPKTIKRPFAVSGSRPNLPGDEPPPGRMTADALDRDNRGSQIQIRRRAGVFLASLPPPMRTRVEPGRFFLFFRVDISEIHAIIRLVGIQWAVVYMRELTTDSYATMHPAHVWRHVRSLRWPPEGGGKRMCPPPRRVHNQPYPSNACGFRL